MDWRDAAKCRDTNPDFFFPVGIPGRRPGGEDKDIPRKIEEQETDVANRFCKGRGDGYACPVMQECLEFAMVNFIHEGVWGGMSEESRRALRRKRLRRARKEVA